MGICWHNPPATKRKICGEKAQKSPQIFSKILSCNIYKERRKKLQKPRRVKTLLTTNGRHFGRKSYIRLQSQHKVEKKIPNTTLYLPTLVRFPAVEWENIQDRHHFSWQRNWFCIKNRREVKEANLSKCKPLDKHRIILEEVREDDLPYPIVKMYLIFSVKFHATTS